MLDEALLAGVATNRGCISEQLSPHMCANAMSDVRASSSVPRATAHRSTPPGASRCSERSD